MLRLYLFPQNSPIKLKTKHMASPINCVHPLQYQILLQCCWLAFGGNPKLSDNDTTSNLNTDTAEVNSYFLNCFSTKS